MSPARVRCPTCEREIVWSEDSPYRPFCSERCKLIDLGAWLGEARGIPGDAPALDAIEERPVRAPEREDP